MLWVGWPVPLRAERQVLPQVAQLAAARERAARLEPAVLPADSVWAPALELEPKPLAAPKWRGR